MSGYGSSPEPTISPITDGSGHGGVYVVVTKTLLAGAIGDTDITMPFKMRVLNVQTILMGTGVANCILTVKSTGDAITDGIAISGADKAKNWALTIDDAYWDIPAGGVLRLTTSVGATQPAVYVIVQGIKVL